jgi:hypothetical protein
MSLMRILTLFSEELIVVCSAQIPILAGFLRCAPIRVVLRIRVKTPCYLQVRAQTAITLRGGGSHGFVGVIILLLPPDSKRKFGYRAWPSPRASRNSSVEPTLRSRARVQSGRVRLSAQLSEDSRVLLLILAAETFRPAVDRREAHC